ncbi:MAG: DUF4234 domain-containing protein [Clostridia bacterium]|nr:DUF4234 domain-containing protein [Clostridia bacterium]
MELIKERSMVKYIFSSLLNFGIGYVAGLLLAILITAAIGAGGMMSFFVIPNAVGNACGLVAWNLYQTWFFYTMAQDVNAACIGDGLETDSFMHVAVLDVVTFGIYRIYWLYKLANRMRVNAPNYGFKMVETGKDIAVMSIFSFGYVSAWELIKNMNRIAYVYNNGSAA